MSSCNRTSAVTNDDLRCTTVRKHPGLMSAHELVTTVAELGARTQPDLNELERALQRFVDTTQVPAPATWPDTTGRYTRVLLNDRNDPFQIIVVFWPPGARSAIHDHADSHGAVAALFGSLSETKYTVVDAAQSRCELLPGDQRALEPGQCSPITAEPGMQLHDMVNATHEWAATIHVYLRAIDHFHVYRATPGGGFVRERRRLWFDYDHGAARWDRPSDAPVELGERDGQLGRTGGCACGALRIEIAAAPTLELSCYCSDCRRSTGSVVAPLAFYPRAAVHLHGQVKLFERRNDSGYRVRKLFCPCCGTTVTHSSESYPHLTGVPVGVLDDASHFRPTTNIYVGSAPAWAPRIATDGGRR